LSANRNKYWLAAISLITVLFASTFHSIKVEALANVSLFMKPAPISSDVTPSFSFNANYFGPPFGTAPTECKVDNSSYTSCSSPYVTPTLAAGSHTFSVHAIGESGFSSTASYDWTVTQLPNFTGDTSTGTVINTNVFAGYLQLENYSTDSITVNLSVPSGVLAMTNTAGLSFNGSHTGSSITFTGTPAQLNTALATLTYTPSSTGAKIITASLYGASGGTNETLNGHYYQYLNPGSGVNWATAKAAADSSTFGGVSGYLANITNLEEDNYLQSRIATGSWVGSNDATSEGDWKWDGGPEAGDSFWSGGGGGSAVGGAYTNWQGLQPDDYQGDEDCGELRQSSGESWNDENCANARGFVIEYGDGTSLPALDTAQISVLSIAEGDSDGDGILNSKEVVGPNKDDANDDGQPDHLQASVGSQPSPIDNKYVVVDSSCTANANTQIKAETAAQKDVAFDYPHGLVSFEASGCGQAGASVNINLFFYGDIKAGEFAIRKMNSNGSFSTISNAQQSEVTIGGQKALKVSYTVIDGGPLDQDGVANGRITDPVGLGKAVIGAPNTGFKSNSALTDFISLLSQKH
jgi:hypothetical protein